MRSNTDSLGLTVATIQILRQPAVSVLLISIDDWNSWPETEDPITYPKNPKVKLTDSKGMESRDHGCWTLIHAARWTRGTFKEPGLANGGKGCIKLVNADLGEAICREYWLLWGETLKLKLNLEEDNFEALWRQPTYTWLRRVTICFASKDTLTTLTAVSEPKALDIRSCHCCT